MALAIEVERAISAERKAALGVEHWPVWGKEVSRFPWVYDSSETCLLIAGEVIVRAQGLEPVHLLAGDLACFPAGLACEWEILQPLRKHYRFG